MPHVKGNVALVLDGQASNAVTRTYTWGLDLSQSLHGAGGVGGLLAAVETQGTSSTSDDEVYWFLYDGNGNVGQVLDATDTDPVTDMRIAAHYEYDPYGNPIKIDNDLRSIAGQVITADAGYATANPFRFSTKWLDDEIDYPGTVNDGLYDYGHRYYTPRLGRWLNRDPIGEEGGLNLYGFTRNQPIGGIDPYGLFTEFQCGTPWMSLISIAGHNAPFTGRRLIISNTGGAFEEFIDHSLFPTASPNDNLWYSSSSRWARQVASSSSTRNTWKKIEEELGNYMMTRVCRHQNGQCRGGFIDDTWTMCASHSVIFNYYDIPRLWRWLDGGRMHYTAIAQCTLSKRGCCCGNPKPGYWHVTCSTQRIVWDYWQWGYSFYWFAELWPASTIWQGNDGPNRPYPAPMASFP